MSGPLLDRIDLRVVMPRVAADELISGARPERSARVAARVQAAWRRSLERNAGLPNAALGARELLGACALDRHGRAAVSDIAANLELTGRGVHRLMRVARTIADLRGLGPVTVDEVYAAASMRDRSLDLDAAA